MGELQGQVYGTRLAGGVPSMEARAALARRALAWWRMNVAEYTASLVLREEPYNILAVSHGGFLGILMESLVKAGDAGPADGVALGWLPNASVSLIEWDGQKGTIVRYGDDGHLAPAGRLDHNVDVLPI
jgi:probable phosphoglycerate mutase